jgi:mono/diheme cytochrome c family protein
MNSVRPPVRWMQFGNIIAALLSGASAYAAPILSGVDGFKADIAPFFEKNCVKCHGPEKSKGKITLHSLDGDLSAGQELARWEKILDVLEFEEMPPEDEPQPDKTERQAIATWIESGLRDYVAKASKEQAAPTARRLTNFEYQNTMRDLFGFELDLIKDLPEDPLKPYHFNNTAEMMLMGTEQIDRYEETARRMLASAIVDPGDPEVHTTKGTWEPSKGGLADFEPDEISITGNRNRTVVNGMRVMDFPETGEYRIRVKAAAILPEGYTEVPLRLVMGFDIVGVGVGSSADQFEPVGTVTLTNDADHPEVFEFRGRIENHPVVPYTEYRRGGKIDGALVKTPAHLTITPQNIFDDGTLNENPDPRSLPRVVVQSIEFEAPVKDVWPPEHHTRIMFDSPLRKSDPDAYVREVLERFITRAFRRPARSEEVDDFAKIYKIVSTKLGLETMEEAMRETLTMVLISPNFLYHTVAEQENERQYELASRLSYFLWGSMPDQELFGLAEAGKLGHPEIIEKQAHRLLADGRSKDFVSNFTKQWLSIDKMLAIPINLDLYPRFLFTYAGGEKAGAEVANRPKIRDYMMAETAGFVGELIRRNDSLFKIVDSDFAMLNQPLAAHYGVEGVEGIGLRPVPIKPENRIGGLLTQGSVLIGNGTGTAPHPIYRAVWLREAILGDKVKDPPADVPALSDSAGESAEKATRIKDLLRLHRKQESCADCHVRLDPWGIPFERYNAIGRYEPLTTKEGVKVQRYNTRQYENFETYLEYLDEIKTEKVEASAKVPHGPVVDGMVDLKKYLLKDRKDEIAANVVRRLLAYGLGRELTYRDRYAVEGLVDQAEENGYKLQDLIVDVCQSDLFTEKKTQ